MISVMKLFFLLVIIKTSNCAVAYDCDGSTIFKRTISLLDTPPCDQSRSKPLVEKLGVVVTQVSNQEDLHVYRCSVKAHHIIKRCGKTFGDDQVVGSYNQIVNLGKEGCQELIERNVLSLPFGTNRWTLSGPGYHTLSYTSAGSSDPTVCEGVFIQHESQSWHRAVRYTTLDIEYSSMTAIVDFETKKVIMANGIRCELNREKCDHGDYGYMYWSTPRPQCTNQVGNQAVIYRGQAELVTSINERENVTFIQLSHGGYDFQIKLLDQSTLICGFVSKHTEHPQLFVTILRSNEPFPNLKSIESRDISMLNYINSKLVYSLRHTKNQVDRLFELFERERCKTNNRITANLMSLATVSPLSFAYSLYQEPGYTAVLRGEVIHVARCQPVDVVPVYNLNGVCYNELVVTHKNRTMYVSPRTRILVPHGKVITCSGEIGPLFRLGGKWVMQTGTGIVNAAKPDVIQVDALKYEFEPLENLANGGLYTSDLISDYQKILVSPMEEAIISSRVVTALSGDYELPDGFRVANSMTQGDLDNIRGSIMGTLNEWIYAPLSWLTQPILVIMSISFLIRIALWLINYILRIKYLRSSTGIGQAMGMGLIEALSHARISKSHAQRSQQSPVDNDEVERTEFMPRDMV